VSQSKSLNYCCVHDRHIRLSSKVVLRNDGRQKINLWCNKVVQRAKQRVLDRLCRITLQQECTRNVVFLYHGTTTQSNPIQSIFVELACSLHRTNLKHDQVVLGRLLTDVNRW